MRLRGEPGLLLQVQGSELRPKVQVLHAALRQAAVLLQVVHAGHDHRDRQLGSARRRAVAGADVGDPSVLLAAGMVFIAVMAKRMFGFKVGRRQWLAFMSRLRSSSNDPSHVPLDR